MSRFSNSTRLTTPTAEWLPAAVDADGSLDAYSAADASGGGGGASSGSGSGSGSGAGASAAELAGFAVVVADFFGVGGVTSGEQAHDAQPKTIPTVAMAYSNFAMWRKYRQPRDRRNWVPAVHHGSVASAIRSGR
jgi:hypothetical protein